MGSAGWWLLTGACNNKVTQIQMRGVSKAIRGAKNSRPGEIDSAGREWLVWMLLFGEQAVGDGHVAEAEGEGFGSSTAFDEFAEFELNDVEAGVE